MVWQLEQTPVTLAKELPGMNRIKERISAAKGGTENAVIF